MKKRITVFLGVINCFLAVYAQGEIDIQPKVFYRNEWSVAIMLNSNGWGANYRYGKRIDAANKRLFEVDFAYMKDPKERKSYSTVSSGSRYVDGKKNLAFDFRFAYGKQHEIFRKQDVGGIAIRYFYNFGPAAVLLKPVYYNVADLEPVPGQPGYSYPIERPDPEKYNSSWYKEPVEIISRASFFKGFDNLNVVPGAFIKLGVNFEYSKQDRIIHALEAGVIAEGFINRVEIMDYTTPPASQSKVAKNQQFFFTVFLSYRFGRIVDPYEVKKKKQRTKEISY
ncbi:MAG: hypothetical protein LBL24_11805 [Bacteroidales bacterium]|nr:hypothetical protein [Bacteroidales bacterium]